MLKVNNISFAGALNTRKLEETYNKRGRGNPLSTAAAENNVMPAELLGRSLVSYNMQDEFWLTIHPSKPGGNYFKLPPKAGPDKYQTSAAKALYDGDDVLVTAPTGTGKTAIAFYIITKNLKEGKKTFYTTPLKALSNEKYKQLQKIYGEENVGLLTGDIKVKPNAPIVVMTTEIYRNMLMGKNLHPDDKPETFADNLKGLKTVVFDELHYMGDIDRGGIWEQSIILSDKDTQLLSLSATIGNNEEINNWITQIRGKESKLINVPPEERHVPLYFRNEMVRSKKVLNLDNMEDYEDKFPPPSFDSYVNIVEELGRKERLPAILFIFSKKAGQDLIKKFKQDGLDLNKSEEKKEISETVKRYNNSGKYLGVSLDVEALTKGYAIHNSGLLPAQKELIEELFQKKLIKVVIATETLSAGINMPARTVVISSTRKPTSVFSADDDGKRNLTVNEFHQMAGRAGRRGIDKDGYVYTLSTSADQKRLFEKLKNSEPDPIKSNFIPEYSFIAHYHKYSQDDNLMEVILQDSFKSYKGENQELLDNFKTRRDTLKSERFITPDNTLTAKGQLLSKLHGYQQIPIIDMVYSQTLWGLSPVQLAACVGTMCMADENIAERLKRNEEYVEKQNFKEKFPNKSEFSHQDDSLIWFINKFDEYLTTYNSKMKAKNPNFFEIAQDVNVAAHLYTWAELNEQNSDSIENWENLYKNASASFIKDEGCLFKEITKTVDLLKQIVKIAEVGITASDGQEDKAYYQELKHNARRAIELLQKKPIPESVY